MSPLSHLERDLFLLAATVVGAAGLTRLVRDHARRRSWLDRPNDRSAHVIPTPRLGGLAIMVAFLACATSVVLATDSSVRLVAAILATAAIGTLGLVDDLRPLSARTRLLVQSAVAATILVLVWKDVPGAWVLLDGRVPTWALYPLSLVWVVWLTNLYNFMDGIDGLAGGQAVSACGVVAAAAAVGGVGAWALVAAGLASSALGFLRYNFPPATIFMGDVGSTAIGFFLGIFPFVAPPGTASVEFVGLAAGLFVLDATVTLLQRLARGERLSQAHRSHYYQRPLASGIGHRAITLSAYAGMFAMSGLAWVFRAVRGIERLLPLLGAALLFLVAVVTVRHLERRRGAAGTR